jgi:SPP1 family predicted phage head-tail adaptor
MYRDSAYLITYTDSVNEIYDPVKIPIPRRVFANKESIGQAEFYQASAQGLKPELKLVIRSKSYQGEDAISYQSKLYKIIRTFERETDFIELICQGVVNNAST